MQERIARDRSPRTDAPGGRRRGVALRDGAMPARLIPGALTVLALLTSCGTEGASTGTTDPGQKGAGQDAKAGNADARAGTAGAEDAIPVTARTLALESISSVYTTSATLRAERQATVTARARGILETLEVEEGARVSAHQILARLDDDDARIAVDRARLSLEARTEELERLTLLKEQKLVSEQEFQTAERARRDAAHVLVGAEVALDRTRLRAPFGGTIVKRHLDPGGAVTEGTAVYDLADLEPLQVDAHVPERHVARLELLQPVRLRLDSTGETRDGRIERLSPAVDPSTGTVKVTVTLDGGAPLRVGSFAKVEIITDTHDQALVVPRSSLVAEGRRWLIFRVDGGSPTRARQLEVRTGFEEGDRVELLEVSTPGERLEPGMIVVVRGAAAVSDGAAIEVQSSGARADTADPAETPKRPDEAGPTTGASPSAPTVSAAGGP